MCSKHLPYIALYVPGSRFVIIYDVFDTWLPDLLLFTTLSALGPPKGLFFKHGTILFKHGIIFIRPLCFALPLTQIHIVGIQTHISDVHNCH